MFQFLASLFGGNLPSMDIESYVKDYFGKNNHILIDVRTHGEYMAGHLPKAKNIPLNELGQKLAEIPKDKTIVMVCRSGSRSAAATRQLLKAGYGDVFNLQGGTMRWQSLGRPMK